MEFAVTPEVTTTEARTETHAELVAHHGHYWTYWRCFSDGARAFAYSDLQRRCHPLSDAELAAHFAGYFA